MPDQPLKEAGRKNALHLIPLNIALKTHKIFLLAAGLEALGGFAWVLSIPPDPKNSFLLGYSLPRLLVMLFFILAAAACVAALRRGEMAIQRVLDALLQKRLLRTTVYFLGAFLAVGCCWAALRLGHVFPQWQVYLDRLTPLLLWGGAVCLQWVLLLIYSESACAEIGQGPGNNPAVPPGCGLLYRPITFASRLFNLLFLGLVPLAMLAVLWLSQAMPFLMVMTLVTYTVLALLLVRARALPASVLLSAAFVGLGVVFFARVFPLGDNFSGEDERLLDTIYFKGGEAVEQDFYLPVNNSRFDALIADDQVEAVARIVGRFDAEKTTLSVNGKAVGTLAELLTNQPEKTFYAQPVGNYILRIPKDWGGSEVVTLRIASPEPFALGFGSGIHPLPDTAHSRLIYPDGQVEDLSARYFNRRFRFQNAIYLISTQYFDEAGSPLILGAFL